MDFMAHFTMGTGGHYITMLLADWSISTSHVPSPSSCHSKKMLWNPSILQCALLGVWYGDVIDSLSGASYDDDASQERLREFRP